MKIISSLERIYDNDPMPEKGITGFSMLKNEKKSFQVAVMAEDSCEEVLSVSGMKGLRVYSVCYVPSEYPMDKKNADSYYRYSESGLYPDLLMPCEDEVHLKRGVNVFWVEADGKENESGSYTVKVSLGESTAEINVEIIGAELCFDDFVYTNWFHTDCLMSHYGFDAFSDEYWRVTESYLKTAREYGMNCVLTPIFTPPLDTERGKERPTVQLVDVEYTDGAYRFCFDKLTRWIEMAHRCGVEYFELSHFYTQWGAQHAPKVMATVDGEYKRIFGWETKADSAEYKAFLKALSKELKAYFEENNLKDKVFIHVSDEPNFAVLRPYKKASGYIHKLFKGYKIMDALSDYWFYRLKIVSNPIPSNDHINKFLGKVDNLWTYYCSAQNNHCVSNRFFCNSSLRNRVIGYQMYKYNIKGFLHWGYNFYYTKLSKKLIDPFKVTDAGGKFPSGDSFVVYPGEDGTPLHSIRLKVFYDALQDMAALRALEKLTDKKTCLDIIEESGRYNLTFREYPHCEEWLLETREKINSMIKSNMR